MSPDVPVPFIWVAGQVPDGVPDSSPRREPLCLKGWRNFRVAVCRLRKGWSADPTSNYKRTLSLLRGSVKRGVEDAALDFISELSGLANYLLVLGRLQQRGNIFHHKYQRASVPNCPEEMSPQLAPGIIRNPLSQVAKTLTGGATNQEITRWERLNFLYRAMQDPGVDIGGESLETGFVPLNCEKILKARFVQPEGETTTPGEEVDGSRFLGIQRRPMVRDHRARSDILTLERIDPIGESREPFYRDYVTLSSFMLLEELSDPGPFPKETSRLSVAAARRNICLDRLRKTLDEKRQLAADSLLLAGPSITFDREEIVVAAQIDVVVPQIRRRDRNQPFPKTYISAHRFVPSFMTPYTTFYDFRQWMQDLRSPRGSVLLGGKLPLQEVDFAGLMAPALGAVQLDAVLRLAWARA